MSKPYNILVQCLSVGFVVLLGGCVTGRYLKDGEEARVNRQPVEARRHFEMALSRKPKLSQDLVFMEKLRVVRRDACMAEGNLKLSREQWKSAILHFEQALKYEPEYRQAVNAIATTRQSGRQQLYNAALNDADENDLENARMKLTRALFLLPNDSLCNQARHSLDKPLEGLSAEQVVIYEAGVAAEGTKSWHSSYNDYSRTVGHSPWHLPARAGKKRSREEIEKADRIAGQAQKAFLEKNIPGSRQLLLALKEVYPQHQRYREILTQVKKVEKEVNELLSRAAKQYEDGQYEQAIEACEEALQIYPGHIRAGNHRDKTEKKLVSVWLDKGTQALAGNQYRAAAASYDRVFKYRFGHHDAKKGLAGISKKVALEYDREGKQSISLLWALHADKILPGTISAPVLKKLRQRVMVQHPLNVELTVTAPSAFTAEAAWLDSGLRPALIQTVAGGQAYNVAVEIVDATAENRVVLLEDLNQPYDVPYEAPNPEWHSLKTEARHLREKIAKDCEIRNGHEINFQRFKKMADPNSQEDTVKLRRLNRERARENKRLDEMEKSLACIHHDLEASHQTVTEYQRHYWNYQKQIVEQAVIVKVRVRIADSKGIFISRDKYFDRKLTATDSMIINPNSDVGIDPDPLEMPSLLAMRKDAVAELAQICQPFFKTAILDHFMSSLHSGAKNANNAETIMSYRLATWMLQQEYAPGEATKTYRKLMDELSYPR